MKDRIPKYAGRVKLVPVENQPDTYDMSRADDPIQEGTPINKKTLLEDETARALGMTEAQVAAATVNDALLHIAKNGAAKVGDIKESVRTDMGSNWALCNGEPFLPEEYPKLSEVLGYSTDFRALPMNTSDYGSAKLLSNGRYIYFKSGYIYDVITGDIAKISNLDVSAITHDGEKWVACSVLSNNIFIYTSDNLQDWEFAYSFERTATSGNAEIPYDIIFDGVTYDVLSEASVFSASHYVHLIKKDFSSHTTHNFSLSASTSEASVDQGLELVACPNNKWFYRVKNGETQNLIQIRNGGTFTPVFASLTGVGESTLEFFNDTYALRTGHSSNIAISALEFLNLSSGNTHKIFIDNIISPQSYRYESRLHGALYDNNTGEWILYVVMDEFTEYAEPLGSRYYALRISENADPTNAANYSYHEIDALPDVLPIGQSSIDRAHMHTDGEKVLLYSPYSKYLPENNGDTYKYINIGG